MDLLRVHAGSIYQLAARIASLEALAQLVESGFGELNENGGETGAM